MDRTVMTSTTDDAEAVAAALKSDDAEAEVAETEEETGTSDETGSRKPEDETVESLRARIKRMTFETHRAVDYAEQMRSLNTSLSGRLAEVEKKLIPADKVVDDAPKFTDPEPTLEDAESIEAWAKDHSTWQEKKIRFTLDAELGKRDKVTAEAAAAETQKQFEERIAAEHQTRLDAFAVDHPDFEDVARTAINEGVPLTPPMLAHIMQSDTGPALLYYLGKNPKIAKEVAALKAGPTLVRLGRIEAMLEAQATGDDGNSRPLTSATGQKKPPPRPPAAIGGTGGKNTKDPAKMTFQEYKAWRAAGGR